MNASDRGTSTIYAPRPGNNKILVEVELLNGNRASAADPTGSNPTSLAWKEGITVKYVTIFNKNYDYD